MGDVEIYKLMKSEWAVDNDSFENLNNNFELIGNKNNIGNKIAFSLNLSKNNR